MRENQSRRPAGGEKISGNTTGAAGGCSASKAEVACTTQFLQKDRQVLRFKALWDDRGKLNGDHRVFYIYYFLADDTIEVTESNAHNSGRDPFPSFLRRQRVLKQAEGERYQNPKLALNFKGEAPEYWSEDDLRIGQKITLFGRTYLPFDCDPHTREYLIDRGVPEEDLQPIDIKVKKRVTPRPPTPPHNGFGEPDDSLNNCKRLANTRPVKSIRQYIDKCGSQLKFSMKLDTTDPTDKIRRFVLTYYLEDDTLSVFEPAMRNSGILGGKFLARQRVRLPPGNELAKAQDFYVGAKVVVSKHTFIIISTDERSINYMEQNSSEFDKSNINCVLDKMRAMLFSGGSGLKAAFDAADTDGSGHLDFDELVGIFGKLGLPIVEQEVLTVLRYFDKDGDGQISYQEFASRMLPDGAATMGQEERSWEEIAAEWAEKKAAQVRLGERDLARQRQVGEGRGAQAMQTLHRFYEQRRQLFHQQLRAACDSAADGKIGQAEFRRVVEDKLELKIPAEQLKELYASLFPPRLQRVPYQEMLRLLESTSNYPHSAKTIGRFRGGGGSFREKP